MSKTHVLSVIKTQQIPAHNLGTTESLTVLPLKNGHTTRLHSAYFREGISISPFFPGQKGASVIHLSCQDSADCQYLVMGLVQGIWIQRVFGFWWVSKSCIFIVDQMMTCLVCLGLSAWYDYALPRVGCMILVGYLHACWVQHYLSIRTTETENADI